VSALDTAYLKEHAEHLSAEDILKWAWETFDHKVATSSSFQTQSVPLLHIISRVCPEMPVIFIDTGFHFPETLTFRDKLKESYGLNIKVMHPVIEQSQLFERYGEGLYRRDPDLCCNINKVEPMRRATSMLQALVSGIRRDQTNHRKILNVFEAQPMGLLRIHPLINWTQDDVWEYIHKHKLLFHPLFSKGYLSIGCAPCTRPVDDREDERAGRWAGKDKTECGLHLDWGDNASKITDKSTE
jgi:phosphoadenosine phosphosulfate reductase